MKKLILIIALLCISTSALAVEPIDFSKSYALSTAIQAAVSAGGAAEGYSETQSCVTTDGVADGGSNYYYLCSRFQASDAGPITKIDLYLKKAGALSGNAQLRIVTDNAGAPSSTVVTNGTNTNTLARNDLGASYAWISYTGYNATLSVGSYYWLCEGDGVYYSTSWNVQIDIGCPVEVIYNGDTWGSLTQLVNTASFRYILYKGTP